MNALKTTLLMLFIFFKMSFLLAQSLKASNTCHEDYWETFNSHAVNETIPICTDRLLLNADFNSGLMISIDLAFNQANEEKTVTNFIEIIGNSENPIVRISIKDDQLILNRLVKHRECAAWDTENCTHWGYTTYGYMEYKTWDDQILKNLSFAKITFYWTDNAQKITVEDWNGRLLSDLSYDGIHNTAMEDLIEELISQGKNLDIKLFIRYTDNMMLGSIDIKTGIPLILDNNDWNPETNLPSDLTSSERYFKQPAIEKPTSFEEKKIEEEVLMYPNPSRGIIYIESNFQDSKNTVLEVMDVTGKTVLISHKTIPKDGHKTSYQLSTELLTSGIYYYKYNYGTNVTNGKIILVVD